MRIEAREGGPATGVSIASNVFGGPAVLKAKLVARVATASEEYVAMEAGFARLAGDPPFEVLSGPSLQSGQEALG